jgi:hypothetical protein
MLRTKTKVGDIFEVKISEYEKKYFQYTNSDLTQLNSDVIRIFKKRFHINANPELLEIVSCEVEFHAHCVTTLGLKMGFWNRIGNIQNIGNPREALFRRTNDYGGKPGELIEISSKWFIWRANDASTTFVGKLIGENRNAEIGVVINPDSIVHRIQTGEYDFIYPGFE